MTYLLVDTCNTGHHMTYIMSLANAGAKENKVIVLMSEFANSPTQNEDNIQYIKITNLKYLSLLKQIKQIVRENKVDIVHFVYADEFVRYFGYGLSRVKCKLILTFHQIRQSNLRNFSRKCMLKKADCGVVHTETLAEQLHRDGIYNVEHIEYPYFQSNLKIDREYAKKTLGIIDDVPVLLALGGTRYDKGLDLLLKALKDVKEPFFLLIAGKEEDIKETEIRNLSLEYDKKVKLILKFLSDEEFGMALSASDFVVLPYRKTFDGASGPLGEGVAYDKVIIGANHGSLGQLIEKNHLGYTFQSEDIESMTKVISKALKSTYCKDAEYRKYQEVLKPRRFQEEHMSLYAKLINK